MKNSTLFLGALLMVLAGCKTASTVAENNKPDVDLKNTRWVLDTLYGKKITTGEGQREAHILLRMDEPRVQGNGSCNGIGGEYTLGKGNALKFGKMMSTMMYCPAMETETAFTQALEIIDSYKIKGEHLTLFSKGKAVATFRAVYL